VTPTETRHRSSPARPSRSIPLEVVAAYNIEDVVATSFNGDFVRGRLLLLDGRPPLLEEVNLARIAGAVIASRLDHYHAAQQLQRGAVAEERVRVARDLHDSVLQALTGIALQLRTIPRVMVRDRAEAEVRLGEIEQVIVTRAERSPLVHRATASGAAARGQRSGGDRGADRHRCRSASSSSGA
jgi:signal transduction histidine kinase